MSNPVVCALTAALVLAVSEVGAYGVRTKDPLVRTSEADQVTVWGVYGSGGVDVPRRFLQQGDEATYEPSSAKFDISGPSTTNSAQVSTVSIAVPTTTTPEVTPIPCTVVYTMFFSVRAKGKNVHRVDNLMEDSLLPGAVQGLRPGDVQELFWQFNIDFGNKVMSDRTCDWITSRTYRMYKYRVTTDDFQAFKQLEAYLMHGSLGHDLEGQKGVCAADVKIIRTMQDCDRP